MRSRRTFIPRLAGLAVVVLSLSLLQTTIAHAANSQIGGFVYVMTNQDSGNSVVVYKRSADGTLHRAQEVSTHGLGSGGTQDPLASQGALTLSSDGKLLFAVNAGSNEISVLGTSGNGLKFLSKANSGGDFPVSVAVHNDFVYVLNAHGTPNVSGFVPDPKGMLHPIAYYWILSETGVRAGEIGALTVANLLLDQGAIRISQSVWHGKIQTVKSKKGNRICEISPLLVEHLRGYLINWKHNPLGLLFATSNGTPRDIDTLRKRSLYPLLQKLGIRRCGFHAFRHGNATVMDQEQVPIATRQNRLGQSDARTTMGYTHAISEDGRRFAARLGQMLTVGAA